MENLSFRLKEIYNIDAIFTVTGQSGIIGAILLGIGLGIIVQKSRLVRCHTVKCLFRMQDFTLFRVGTILLAFGIGINFLFRDLGLIDLHPPKTIIAGQIIGGVLFGIGVAKMGHCPGLVAGALGEGRLDAIPGILGIMSGVTIYAEFIHESWIDNIIKATNIGNVSATILPFPIDWIVITPFVLMFLISALFISTADGFMKYPLILLSQPFKLLSKILRKLS